MILVAGGTGTLGRQLVPLLSARGHSVRVLGREPKRAPAAATGVEFMTGDLLNAADVGMAVQGCRVVVSAVHGFAGPGNPSPESIDRDANRTLIQAAKAAGVAHFVLISGQGARADHPLSLHRAKMAAEASLRESGLVFTILRPTAFMETWMGIIGATLADKGYALVFGPGQNPVNFVSARDVAALAAIAVEDVALQGQMVEIGGPEDSSFVHMAEALIEATGKPARIKHIPLPVLRAMSVVAQPFSPVFARKARAAVIMNTTDCSFRSAVRERFPTLPRTTLTQLLAR